MVQCSLASILRMQSGRLRAGRLFQQFVPLKPLLQPAAAQKYAAVTSYMQHRRLRVAASESKSSQVLRSVPAQGRDEHDIRLVQDTVLLRTEAMPVNVNTSKPDGSAA